MHAFVRKVPLGALHHGTARRLGSKVIPGAVAAAPRLGPHNIESMSESVLVLPIVLAMESCKISIRVVRIELTTFRV